MRRCKITEPFNPYQAVHYKQLAHGKEEKGYGNPSKNNI